MKIDKYSHYLKKYNKIKGIYNSQKDVINFINQYSNISIQPFPYTKLLTFHDYKYKYFQRHQKYLNIMVILQKKLSKKQMKILKNF